jgi:hypothetical protein
MKQIEVTYASVEYRMGFGRDKEAAWVWIWLMMGWIISSGDFLRRRARSSLPSGEKGVSVLH